MTPIKIPRKNTRKKRPTVVTANPTRNRPTPLGRPKNRQSASLRDLFDGRKKLEKSSKSQSLKKLKSKRKMSTLEKMPIELLHRIFLLSMNLDLPRSSPIIAGKLSSDQTFVHFIILGFESSWEWDYRVRTGLVCQRLLDITPGDPKMETAILRCPFATLPRLMKAQEIWLRRALSDPTLNGPGVGLPVVLNNNNVMDDDFVEYFTDFSTNTNQIEENWHDIVDEFPDKWNGLLSIHPDTEIPESLLHGPWTSDMMKKFFWLARAHAKIDWISSTSGEVALLGLRTAVKTGNLQALWILHWLGTSEYITYKTLTWAIDNAGGDKSTLLPRLKTMYEGFNPEDRRPKTLKV